MEKKKERRRLSVGSERIIHEVLGLCSRPIIEEIVSVYDRHACQKEQEIELTIVTN